tara:strand:+ start:1654 stop:2694 length:1041 start_codon:yes stop_codon:yes gene_type:complete
VGVEGQSKISKSRIVCIGAGGLGSPVIQYLAAAGVGHLTIIDDDIVDVSNLQRQTIHKTSAVGLSKSESAKSFVESLDPNLSVTSLNIRLDVNNAEGILRGHDLVVDGTDNIYTRYLIDDTCKELNIPWVYGSVYRFEGQVSVFNYNSGPCYRDLFPNPPPEDVLPSCSEAGVFGAITGMIGCLQVSEIIKIISGIGTPLSGKLLVYNVLDSNQKILKFGKLNQGHIEKDETSQADLMFTQVSSAEAVKKLADGWSPYFIDVRSYSEWESARISIAEYICPHDEISSAIDQIPKDKDILVHCRSGMRSQIAIMQLIKAGFDGQNLYNLRDGIIGWAEVKPEDIIQP